MIIRNLFFDFDGMKFDTVQAQVHYINKAYGLSISMYDYLKHNHDIEKLLNSFIPNLGLTRDEIYRAFGKDFLCSIEAHENILPMPGMCEVMPLLKKEYKIHTVTARQKIGLPVIEYILDKYIPGCISNIHCVWGHTEGKGFHGISKKSYVESTEGENVAFFDDSPHEIEDMQDVIPSYLYDPNGFHYDKNEIHRVVSFMQIWRMFK